MYEHTYGINNYENEDTDPLLKFKYNSCEDVTINNSFDILIDNYLKNRINEHYGINFETFINLPSDVSKKLIEGAGRYTKIKNEIMQQIQNDIEKK